jgi:hypothetical protein
LSNPPRKRDSHTFARVAHDLYVERPWCSERLFLVEAFPEPVWDPCAGTGTIVESACAAGLKYAASDISTGRDFLIEPALVPLPFSVVTNPPYALAREIVERALELGAVKVAIFFPVARMNAAWCWLELLPLAHLHLLTPRPSVFGGGRVDFCWLVIDRRHVGAPTWGWLHCDDARNSNG